MIDMMEYKGYYGSVHYSDEDRCFYGKIEHIRGLVSYEGHDVDSIKEAFEEGVDDYLATCKAKNIIPDKSFKGLLMSGQALIFTGKLIFTLKRKK